MVTIHGGATGAGIKFAQNGLWEKAQDVFAIVAQDENTPGAHYNLGIAYEAQGAYAEAADAYNRAIDMKPKDLYIEALANIKKCIADREKLRQQGVDN